MVSWFSGASGGSLNSCCCTITVHPPTNTYPPTTLTFQSLVAAPDGQHHSQRSSPTLVHLETQDFLSILYLSTPTPVTKRNCHPLLIHPCISALSLCSCFGFVLDFSLGLYIDSTRANNVVGRLLYRAPLVWFWFCNFLLFVLNSFCIQYN